MEVPGIYLSSTYISLCIKLESVIQAKIKAGLAGGILWCGAGREVFPLWPPSGTMSRGPVEEAGVHFYNEHQNKSWGEHQSVVVGLPLPQTTGDTWEI